MKANRHVRCVGAESAFFVVGLRVGSSLPSLLHMIQILILSALFQSSCEDVEPGSSLGSARLGELCCITTGGRQEDQTPPPEMTLSKVSSDFLFGFSGLSIKDFTCPIRAQLLCVCVL